MAKIIMELDYFSDEEDINELGKEELSEYVGEVICQESINEILSSIIKVKLIKNDGTEIIIDHDKW